MPAHSACRDNSGNAEGGLHWAEPNERRDDPVASANPARASSAFKSALKPRADQMLERAGVYLARKWLFLFADILGQPIMCREYPRWPGRPRAHCGAVTSVSRAASRAVLHQRITRSRSAPAPKPPAIVVGHNATCRRLERTSSAVSGASFAGLRSGAQAGDETGSG
jgi:hypothetical protein